MASRCGRLAAEAGPAAAARSLVQDARARWPADASDDITALVVVLRTQGDTLLSL